MGYVRYVGRVGALAVALGVGSAVATMPGVALAEPSDSSSSSSSSSSGPSSSSASSSTDKESPSSPSSSSSSAPTSSTETDSSSSADSSTAPDPRTGIVQRTGGAQTSSTGSKTDELSQVSVDASSALTTTSTVTDDGDDASSTLAGQPSVSEPAPTRTVSPTASPQKGDVDGAAKTSSRTAPSPASTPSMPQGNPRSGASTLQSPNTFRLTNTTSSPDLRTFTLAAPAAGSSPIALAATSTETVTPQFAPPALSRPLAPLSIVTGVVSSLLGWVGLAPSMTESPVAPPQAPVLWTLLAWVRREIEQTLVNLTPSRARATAQLAHC